MRWALCDQNRVQKLSKSLRVLWFDSSNDDKRFLDQMWPEATKSGANIFLQSSWENSSRINCSTCQASSCKFLWSSWAFLGRNNFWGMHDAAVFLLKKRTFNPFIISRFSALFDSRLPRGDVWNWEIDIELNCLSFLTKTFEALGGFSLIIPLGNSSTTITLHYNIYFLFIIILELYARRSFYRRRENVVYWRFFLEISTRGKSIFLK